MNKCHFEIKGSIQKPAENGDVFFADTGTNKDVTSLAMVVDSTKARVWADLLKQEVAEAALNPQKELPEAVLEATRKTAKKMGNAPMPSVSFLVSRISNGIFETFAYGDCSMVVHYQDGIVESYTGNKLSETSDIKSSRVARISRDRRRNLSTYTDNSMWSLAARTEAVQSIALLSCGVTPALMNDEITKKVISNPNKKEAAKILGALSVVGSFLKEKEEGKVRKVSSANRSALLLDFVDERLYD